VRDDAFARKGGRAVGLVSALAEACFTFLRDADLDREYQGRALMPGAPTSITLQQIVGRIRGKSRRVSSAAPTPAAVGTWDPDDRHLLRIAIRGGGG
jgi:hypothetical protein